MLSRTMLRLPRQAQSSRAFATYARLMAGETGSGASRMGGERAGDSFTKREAASEELWIKTEERKKLKELRAKLAAQKDHITSLQKSIDEMMGEEDPDPRK